MIEARLSKQDDAIKENLVAIVDLREDVAALNATQEANTKLLAQSNDTLKQLVERGDKWHEADLDFRGVMVQRISAVETTQRSIMDEQSRLASQMKLIRWVVATTSCLTRFGSFVGRCLAGAKFWQLLLTAALFYAMHLVAPQLTDLIRQVMK